MREDLNELSKLLEYAVDNVEFYKRFKTLDFNGDVLRSLEELPIVNKAYMRENLENFVADSIRCDDLKEAISTNKDFRNEYTYVLNGIKVVSEYTSGSSGIPFLSLKTPGERILLGKQTWKLRNAIMPVSSRNLFNFIHNFGDYPYPFPFYEEDTLEETLAKEVDYFSKNNNFYWWHINQQKLNEYVSFLNGEKWTASDVRIIENNGAYLSPKEIEYFEQVFGAKIVNNYGCREVWTIAFDDSEGHLRINSPCIYFELVDDDGRIITEPNKEGYVVLTSLKQYVMPFIRYKIGDRAYYTDEYSGERSRAIKLCPNRSKIVGTEVYGNEFFRGVIFDLTYFLGIRKFDQITVVQKELDLFEINIRRNKEPKELIEKSIRELVAKAMNDKNYRIVFSYDDNKVQKSVFLVNIQK